MHVLIAGCGWLGTALARALLARGDRVTGVRSDPGRAAALATEGIEPLALDLAVPGTEGRIPDGVEAIVACQSARGDGPVPYRRAYVDATMTLLAAAARPGVRALVYTGSTGVFGQRDGSDVDELTPSAPASPSAHVLVEAERNVLVAATAGVPSRIVRLSGLYGPGRTWMIDRVRSGQLALGPGDGAWMNSCHLDDAVNAVVAVLDRGRDGAVYHATDAEPMRRREVVAFVAQRLGIPAPRVDASAGSVGSAGSVPGMPDRRILGLRTRTELGLTLRWWSLREGLEPFLAGPPPGR